MGVTGPTHALAAPFGPTHEWHVDLRKQKVGHEIGEEGRRGRRLGTEDHVVRWAKPTSIRSLDRETYNGLPDSIPVREARVRVRQPGFRTKSVVVVTTLLDPRQATKEDLAALYRARWNAEMFHPHYPSSDHLYHARWAA